MLPRAPPRGLSHRVGTDRTLPSAPAGVRISTPPQRLRVCSSMRSISPIAISRAPIGSLSRSVPSPRADAVASAGRASVNNREAKPVRPTSIPTFETDVRPRPFCIRSHTIPANASHPNSRADTTPSQTTAPSRSRQTQPPGFTGHHRDTFSTASHQHALARSSPQNPST